MKKLVTLFSLLILVSCSSNESVNDSNPSTSSSVLVKRIVSSDDGEDNFHYIGNKLDFYSESQYTYKYTYTGDLISKEEVIENGQLTGEKSTLEIKSPV